MTLTFHFVTPIEWVIRMTVSESEKWDWIFLYIFCGQLAVKETISPRFSVGCCDGWFPIDSRQNNTHCGYSPLRCISYLFTFASFRITLPLILFPHLFFLTHPSFLVPSLSKPVPSPISLSPQTPPPSDVPFLFLIWMFFLFEHFKQRWFMNFIHIGGGCCSVQEQY